MPVAKKNTTPKKKTTARAPRRAPVRQTVVRETVVVTPKARRMVGPITAIKNFWRKYFDFVGRSTRAEFWFGFLFVLIVNWLVAFFVEGTIPFFINEPLSSLIVTVLFMPWCFVSFSGEILPLVVGALLFIPFMALCVRRFRDAGMSVWLYLVPLLIIVLMPIVRGAAWYSMMSMGYISSGMVIYSLFFIIDRVFNFVIACLPSKR